MSAKNDVESFLEDLDNLVPKNQSSSENKSTENQNKEASSGATSNQQSTNSGSSHSAADAQSLLDDLDSLVQQRRSTNISSSNKSSSTSTLTQPKPTSQQSDNPSTSTTTSTTNTTQPQSTTDSNPTTTSSTGGGWGGWGGSVWSSATRIADQARLELERRAQEAATAYDQLHKSTSQQQNEKNVESGGGGDAVHQPVQDPTLPITNATPQEQERARETAEILRKEISRRGWAFAQGLRGLVAEGGLEKLGE